MGEETLSPWWRRAVLIVILGGFAILIWLAFRSYSYAPPVPEKAAGPMAEQFSREQIFAAASKCSSNTA